MPRRKKILSFKRIILPDPVYGVIDEEAGLTVQRLINVVMWRGKKNAARTIVYEALDVLEKKVKGDKEKALRLFQEAMENVMPVIEVRPRRVGGSVYQVPMEVNPDRRRSLAMRWLVDAASDRSDKSMGRRLGYELIDAAEGKGAAAKKKADVHRMAEANRAFSHYAW
ncbi:30S ribosomal protein S7 [Candidatus Dependentiae bacterium HGW-Dependentiae-1]|nr:MAG: 30S ribosomal protein S7 [Candidatus Dependentiae bacterium HGW-Dependentiae-1]